MNYKQNKKIWVSFPYTNCISWFWGLQHKYEYCKLLSWEPSEERSNIALVERPNGEKILVACNLVSFVLLE